VIDSSTFSCFTDVSAKRDAVKNGGIYIIFKRKLTCISKKLKNFVYFLIKYSTQLSSTWNWRYKEFFST
jgi:hypothetical protein